LGLSDIRYFLEDYADSILIITGVASFSVGLLLLSSLPSTASILGFFFGIILTATGFLVRTEVIIHNDSRASKMGALLIFASVVLFAACFNCFLLRDIGQIVVVVPFGFKLKIGESPRFFEVRIVEFSYPLHWLIIPLFLGAISSLITGIVLKRR